MRNFNYQAYLNSEHWKKRRAEIIEARKVCEICGSSDNLRVHHLSYKRLGKEDDKDLMLLCDKCHSNLHTDENAFPYMDFEKGIEMYPNKKAIYLSFDKQFPDGLTITEIGKLTEIIRHIREHQILRDNNGFSDKEFVDKYFMGAFNIEERQWRDFIRKLIDFDVIRYVEINGCKAYFFNPLYAMYGRRLTYITFRIFRNVLQDKVPEKIVEKFEEQIVENMTNIKIIE